jgi:hypothetical protein
MSQTKPSKKLERLHLARAMLWPIALPAILLLGVQDSVFLVLCLSLYANMAGDIGAWQAARAERRSLEHPSQDA